MDSSANARLEILYRQCYPSLYRYALWALRDHHQAEEAVQETFLSALPKAAEVTALDRPEGWLMQTVKHKVLHLRREQDRRRARMLPLEEKLPAPDRLGQWEESEDAALLWQQATQRLSPQDAELLRLVALEEQSQQAAAEEMGLSLWACQKRLQRIRKKLPGPAAVLYAAGGGAALRRHRPSCGGPEMPAPSGADLAAGDGQRPDPKPASGCHAGGGRPADPQLLCLRLGDYACFGRGADRHLAAGGRDFLGRSPSL